MLRYFSHPSNARILHGGVGVEALGDGVADEGGAPFLQELDLPLLPGGEGVKAFGLAVEEGGDGALFIFGGKEYREVPYELPIRPWHFRTVG